MEPTPPPRPSIGRESAFAAAALPPVDRSKKLAQKREKAGYDDVAFRLPVDKYGTVATWTPREVVSWARTLQLDMNVQRIFGHMTGISLALLTKNDLAILGVTHLPQVMRILERRDMLLPEGLRRHTVVVKRTPSVIYNAGGPANAHLPASSKMDGDLVELLNDARLEALATLLDQQGIDDVPTLMAFSEEELVGFGVKRGHVRRVNAAAKRLMAVREAEKRAADAAAKPSGEEDMVAKQMLAATASQLGTELTQLDQEEKDHLQRLQNIDLKTRRRDGTLWEVDRDALTVGPILGSGAFGDVFKGTVAGAALLESSTDGDAEMTVAVKTLKSRAAEEDKNDFLAEILLMQELEAHPNVVHLLGICIRSEPMFMIVPFMKDGNLRDYLRDNRPDSDLKPTVLAREMLSYARDAAAGMEFLADAKCVHRDLAARNVLVDKPLARIADFGLARYLDEEYQYIVQTRQRKLPTKWLAPECILYKEFTVMSDVWAFGIVLWEICMMGAMPYPGISAMDLVTMLTGPQRSVSRPPRAFMACFSDVFPVFFRCLACVLPVSTAPPAPSPRCLAALLMVPRTTTAFGPPCLAGIAWKSLPT